MPGLWDCFWRMNALAGNCDGGSVEARSSQSVQSKALAIFARTLEIFDMAGIVAPFLEVANRVTSDDVSGAVHAGGDESVSLWIFQGSDAGVTARRRLFSSTCRRFRGPLLDRIDIHLDVRAVRYKELRTPARAEDSASVRGRVIAVRDRQSERYKADKNDVRKAQMMPKMIRKFCAISAEGEKLLENAIVRLGLSARAHDRILKVARTIADLDAGGNIEPRHLSEAIQYRTLDRYVLVAGGASSVAAERCLGWLERRWVPSTGTPVDESHTLLIDSVSLCVLPVLRPITAQFGTQS